MNKIPYYSINEYYKKRFGEKVYKISVSVPGSCPNRDGLNGMKACIFCDEWGSAAFPEFREEDLVDQIIKIREVVRIRNKVNKFLLYFQAYTNTFKRTDILRKHFEVGLSLEDICGFVVGTRPDCISDAALKLWNDFQGIKPVFVELGVQSFNDEKLKWMERGHDSKKSDWAVRRIQNNCPEVNIGIHLILGLPNETDEEIKETAEKINKLKVNNVKLHNMHVLKNTPLAKEYREGRFKPVEIEDYVRRMTLFLQYLNPEIAVHRLTAVASRHDDLIAPRWTKEKMRTYQFAIDYMNNGGISQGQFY